MRKARTDRRVLCLTFDDGPHPGYTPAKLDILARHGVPAAFFVVGKLAARWGAILKEVRACGGEVCNHAYSHPRLTSLSAAGIDAEIARTGQAIAEALGEPGAPLFRPPYGVYDGRVLKAAGARGYLYNVLWSVDPADWRGGNGLEIARRVLAVASPGDIVLLHDIVKNTVEALPFIIARARARGYRFAPLGELLGRVRGK